MKKEFGIVAFWLIITFLISTVLGFYYYPAENKIEKLSNMLEKSEIEKQELESKTEELDKELKDLEIPFYIEKILRTKYKWVPNNGMKKIEEISSQ